jgi:tRNA-specific 2-thiouridylase
VLDYETRFRETVIDGFASSYIAGETPVPCIACNQTVKFADLLDTARQLGAAALATGHYVLSQQSGPHRTLHRPIDGERDQSYFLFSMTPPQLDFVRFPLGGMTKAEVRAAAREFGLAVADKHDSQDICFVPNGKYSEVIEKLRPGAATAGDIVHIDGRVLGRHHGIIHYTIGQRRGIGVAVGEPLYVVHLDPQGRRVVVGPREALLTRRLHLRAVNWLGEGSLAEAASSGLDIHARVRSSRAPAPARLTIVGGDIVVELGDSESGVAPGQACVFYESEEPGGRVLGGGWIERAERSGDAEVALRQLIAQPAAVA